MGKKTNLDIFWKIFPDLKKTTETLTNHNIDWCIGGSGALFLLGNDRLPDDVDIYVRNEQHDLVDTLFGITSFQYTSPLENVRNSNPQGDHDLQITSHLDITAEGKTYHWRLDNQLLTQSKLIGDLRLLPPEDVLLIKALLQRGEELGKHDIEDIKNFEESFTIDKTYLYERVKTIGAEERVCKVWPDIS